MQLLKYLLILPFVIFSCKRGASSSSENINVLVNSNKENLIAQSNDSIYIKDNDLIIFSNSKKLVYKSLIVKASSLFTSLEVIDKDSFYLIYEYSASSTKMTHIYQFIIENENLFLVWKEALKLDKGIYGSNKINYNKIPIPRTDGFDYLEPLGESIKVSYTSNEKKAVTNVFNESNKKIDSIKYSITGLERFMNPIETLSKTY
jgi:hypothetical protein